MAAEGLARLREPFPADQVGLLPKVTCKDCSDKQRQCQKHQRAKCDTCGAYVSTAHIHLDYVGHGAVRSRLLEVDPEWNWEPIAVEPSGAPAFVYDKGNPVEFWIRLTVCGVTRIGVGTCPSGQFDAAKVLIGDALRNAAMSFGVALDLWIKGHAEDDERQTASDTRSSNRGGPPPSDPSQTVPAAPKAKVDQIMTALAGMDERAIGRLKAWVYQEGLPDHPRDLSDEQADKVLAKIGAGAEPQEGMPQDAGSIPAGSGPAASPGVQPGPKAAEAPAPNAQTSFGQNVIDARAIGIRAPKVFDKVIDHYPDRKKSWVQDHLRHALAYVVSDGKATSTSQLDGPGLMDVWQRLNQLEDGSATLSFSADPANGCSFNWPDGSESTVMWTELTLAEAS